MNRVSQPSGPGPAEVDFHTLDLLPYGIIVINAQGTILYYNAREEQIAGRKRENVIGRNFFTDIAPCTQAREFYQPFREVVETAGFVANFQFSFPFATRPREVEITLSSFRNGTELLCLITVSDLTEQDDVRERILRAERLREAGEVAAGVAHNFNNLLTVIRSNAELVALDLADDERLREKLEKIMRATDDGAKIVQRIRESARQQPEPAVGVKQIDLNALVRDSIVFTEDYATAQAAQGTTIVLETDLAPALPPVRARASELREVFVNLLRNAVDAIQGEGRISVRSYARGATSIVEVSDTGRGMDADVQAKIFRPLFTTKGARGTGMGLATCYAIVRRHGGDIEVASTPGAGTTFTVRLPAAAAT